MAFAPTLALDQPGAAPAGTPDAAPPLRETPLTGLHRALGARMVPFAGHAMPLHYPDGILAEHRHCRAAAALFDVSHMGQAELTGERAAEALERLSPADLAGLRPGRQRYALLLDEGGGIFDDCMVANLGDRLLVVVNASRREADLDRLAGVLPPGVRLRRREDRALLALQGPGAWPALAAHAPMLGAMAFLDVAELDLFGVPAVVARSGYTGEDGFEISVPAGRAEALARALLDLPGVRPAGLGARDGLRLEAGLPLYGQDLDAATGPVEAGLTWTLGKRRRMAGDYPGAARVARDLAEGTARRRVGLRPEGRQPARAGAAVLAADGSEVGRVTSGGFSPELAAPIAMAYVDGAHAADGTALSLSVRGRALAARVVPLPFVPHRTVRREAARP